MYLFSLAQHDYFETKVIVLIIIWYLEISTFYTVTCRKSGYMSHLHKMTWGFLETAEIICTLGLQKIHISFRFLLLPDLFKSLESLLKI